MYIVLIVLIASVASNEVIPNAPNDKLSGYVSEKALGKGSNLLGHHFQNRNSIEAKKLINDNVLLMMQSALEKVLNNKHESRRKREVPGELNSEFYDVESLQENAKPPGPNDESDAMFSSPYSGPKYLTWIKKGDDRLNTLKRTHYAFDHLARMKKGFAFDHLARMRKSYAFDHLARMKKGLAFDHLARMKKERSDGRYEYILCVLSLRDYQDYQHC